MSLDLVVFYSRSVDKEVDSSVHKDSWIFAKETDTRCVLLMRGEKVHKCLGHSVTFSSSSSA